MKWIGKECVKLETCFPGLVAAEKESFVRFWSKKEDWEDIPGSHDT